MSFLSRVCGLGFGDKMEWTSRTFFGGCPVLYGGSLHLGAIALVPNDDGVVRVDHIFEIALDGVRFRDGDTGRDGSRRDGGPAGQDGPGRH